MLTSTVYHVYTQVQVRFFLDNWSEIRRSESMRSVWQEIRIGRHPGFEEGADLVRPRVRICSHCLRSPSASSLAHYRPPARISSPCFGSNARWECCRRGVVTSATVRGVTSSHRHSTCDAAQFISLKSLLMYSPDIHPKTVQECSSSKHAERNASM